MSPDRVAESVRTDDGHAHVSPPGDPVTVLLALLEEERAAVRARDGAALDRIATAKDEAAVALAALPPAWLAARRGELARLKHALRQSALLLSGAQATAIELRRVVDEQRRTRARELCPKEV
jgi:phytoene dehydrogenase-like protein